MIKIESLYKSFGDNKILENINLNFSNGEVVGIVGENGAGKSTLFNCLIGLESFKGTIIYSQGNLKDRCGFLPTDPFFLSKITAYEYLQLVCRARGFSDIDLDSKNVFDLPLERYAETFSTGMKKKLALTGILLLENEIFILDEPFNGVDIQSNLLIKELILKLKELGKIVILSSHIFSTLTETCDILHHLKDGHIMRSVRDSDFHLIEKDMAADGLGNRLDVLGLK